MEREEPTPRDEREGSGAPRRGRLLALLLLVACSPENPPYEESVASANEYLPTVLAPGAKIAFYGEGTRNATAEVWPLDGGGFVASLSPMPVVNAGDAFGGQVGLVFATSEGTVVSEQVAGGFLVGTPLGNDAFLAVCGQESFAALADTTLRRLADLSPATEGYRLCQGIFGRGATAERVIQASSRLETIFLHTVDRAAGSHTVSTLFRDVPTPADASLVFVDEPQAGQIAAVLRSGDSLVFVDPAAPTSAITATGLSGALGRSPVWRGRDGALRIATATGLYVWDTAQPAVQKLGDVPASPTDTAWIPSGGRGAAIAQTGPRNDAASVEKEEIIPERMAALTTTDTGFAIFEPPLTPCCDRDACRTGGESYLLGAEPAGAKTVAFYDVWSWQDCLGCKVSALANERNGYHALVAAPAPAACSPTGP